MVVRCTLSELTGTNESVFWIHSKEWEIQEELRPILDRDLQY